MDNSSESTDFVYLRSSFPTRNVLITTFTSDDPEILQSDHIDKEEEQKDVVQESKTTNLKSESLQDSSVNRIKIHSTTLTLKTILNRSIEWDSMDSAKEDIFRYAVSNGFLPSTCKTDKNGKYVSIGCHCRGKPTSKGIRKRPSLKCGCPWRLNIWRKVCMNKDEAIKYHITNSCLKHNHELFRPNDLLDILSKRRGISIPLTAIVNCLQSPDSHLYVEERSIGSAGSPEFSDSEIEHDKDLEEDGKFSSDSNDATDASLILHSQCTHVLYYAMKMTPIHRNMLVTRIETILRRFIIEKLANKSTHVIDIEQYSDKVIQNEEKDEDNSPSTMNFMSC